MFDACYERERVVCVYMYMDVRLRCTALCYVKQRQDVDVAGLPDGIN